MSTRGVISGVLPVVLLVACGPGAVEPEPARPGTADQAAARGPARGQECAWLRARLAPAVARLAELAKEPALSPARHNGVADVLERLVADLAAPVGRDDVSALAAEYATAARDAGAAAREMATHLVAAERLNATVKAGTEHQAFKSVVRRVHDACRDSAAADCERVVGVLQALGTMGPTVSLVDSARAALRGLKATTPALGAALPELETALAKMSGRIAAAEKLHREGPLAEARFEAAYKKLVALGPRLDAVCGDTLLPRNPLTSRGFFSLPFVLYSDARVAVQTER
jgi:hypothetical protein